MWWGCVLSFFRSLILSVREGNTMALLVYNMATMKLHLQPLSSSRTSFSKNLLKNQVRCTALQQQQVDTGIACEPCNGRGWLLCDFCKGQKTSVKAANNRIYRRCPSCKAVGYILCSNCKVFKCVTFPNYDDGEELAF